MLGKNLANQLPKNRLNSTCKTLSVQLENSISPLDFQQMSTIFVTKFNLVVALFKIKEMLKIKQKAFDLFLIKRRVSFWKGGGASGRIGEISSNKRV